MFLTYFLKYVQVYHVHSILPRGRNERKLFRRFTYSMKFALLLYLSDGVDVRLLNYHSTNVL